MDGWEIVRNDVRLSIGRDGRTVTLTGDCGVSLFDLVVPGDGIELTGSHVVRLEPAAP